MNKISRIIFFGLCPAFLPMLTPPAAAAQCYGKQTAGPPPGTLAQGLSESIRRSFLWAKARGEDSAAFFDTTRLGFTLIFYTRNPDTLPQEPKRFRPSFSAVRDSFADEAYLAWARILYSKYPIYDYFDPSIRLQSRDSASRHQYGMATYAVLGDLSRECFTSYVDLGEPNGPISVIRPKRVGAGAGRHGPRRFDPLGRSMHKAAVPGSDIILNRWD